MKSNTKLVMVYLAQTQAEIGITQASLIETHNIANKIGSNTQQIIDLCNKFKI